MLSFRLYLCGLGLCWFCLGRLSLFWLYQLGRCILSPRKWGELFPFCCPQTCMSGGAGTKSGCFFSDLLSLEVCLFSNSKSGSRCDASLHSWDIWLFCPFGIPYGHRGTRVMCLGFASSLVVSIFLGCEAPKWLRYICSEAVGAPFTQLKASD